MPAATVCTPMATRKPPPRTPSARRDQIQMKRPSVSVSAMTSTGLSRASRCCSALPPMPWTRLTNGTPSGAVMAGPMWASIRQSIARGAAPRPRRPPRGCALPPGAGAGARLAITAAPTMDGSTSRSSLPQRAQAGEGQALGQSGRAQLTCQLGIAPSSTPTFMATATIARIGEARPSGAGPSQRGQRARQQAQGQQHRQGPLAVDELDRGGVRNSRAEITG